MSDAAQGSGWWRASDGKWYAPQDADVLPPPPPPAPGVGPPSGPGFVLTIGDIGVTRDSVVTPNGTAPLAGSQWIVVDRTTTSSEIPTWAIVMAVLFALACLLGLLFLLVKETRVSGSVEVSVRSGSLVHLTQLPVRQIHDVDRYRWLVGQAQSLAAQAAG